MDVTVHYANDDTNRALLIIACILSTIGCLITIFTYYFNKDIRTMSRHIIVCISIADLISCISNLVGMTMRPTTGNKTQNGCMIQSFVGTTAILSSFLWTSVLIIYLYLVIVKERLTCAKRMVIPFGHLVCWLLPLTINIVALLKKKLGNDGDATSGGWCWIKISKKDGVVQDKKLTLLWMIIDGKGIEIAAYIIILVLCVIIKLHLKYKIQNFSRCESPYGTFLTRKTMVAAKQADRKLIFVPIIFFVLRFWGTIRFFIYATDTKIHKHVLQPLVYLHTLGDNLQGAMNCLLFCFFTPKVFHHIVEGCCQFFQWLVGRCCCCLGDKSTCMMTTWYGRVDGDSGSDEEGMTPTT